MSSDTAARLRELRGRRSPEAMAREIGVTTRAYQHWEAGRNIAYTNVVRAAEVFKVTPEYLLYGREPERPANAQMIASRRRLTRSCDTSALAAKREGGRPGPVPGARGRNDANGIARPARIYDMRPTFASDALAAGVSVFELARIMGTSLRMIEKSYGALLDGAGAGLASRLDALDAERDRGDADAREDER